MQEFKIQFAQAWGFLVTQVIFVSRGATECFHRLELPTQEERCGINWRRGTQHLHYALETGQACS